VTAQQPAPAAYYEAEDGLARVYLNRPRQINAFNVQMRDDLYEVLSALHLDGDIDAVLIRGNGERGFCSGADLTEFGTAPSRVIAREARYLRDVWKLLRTLPVPTVVAMHGFTIGSGLELALCCDLRIAADDTRFRLPEVALGMLPFATGSQTLPRVIGRSRALDLLLTSRWFDAQEALRMGLVHRVVPRASLTEAALETVSAIRRHPRSARRRVKAALQRGADATLAQGLAIESGLARAVLWETTQV
jgi:enoyl-CoA hydratase